jgi:peptidoglycan/LPS O-acetylase OafA/YrhL
MNAQSAIPERRWDIDWLRVLVVLMLVPYHSARIFDLDDWYVKNEQLSSALNYWFIYFFNVFGMQLLFLLAGAAAYYALRRRSAGQYARERFTRLLVPLVFGTFAIVPLQSYCGKLHHSDYDGSFLDYYANNELDPNDVEGYLGGSTVGHLWFILILFLLALAALPLFAYLRGESGRRWIDRLAGFLTRPGAIFLLAIPPLVIRLLMSFDPNPLYYLVFFVYGYVMVADARFEQALDRHKRAALFLWLPLYLGWVGIKFGLDDVPAWVEELVTPYYVFTTCCALIAILGYGRQYLKFGGGRSWPDKVLIYFGVGSYPYYILHQTVIVLVGFYVVRWDMALAFKYAIVVVISFAATVLIYDLLVRRTRLTRFLFGMRT